MVPPGWPGLLGQRPDFKPSAQEAAWKPDAGSARATAGLCAGMLLCFQSFQSSTFICHCAVLICQNQNQTNEQKTRAVICLLRAFVIAS